VNAVRPVCRPAPRGEVARLAPADLPTADACAMTNSLYGSRGLRANELIWYWQACRPARVAEWVTLAAQDARLQIALDGDAVGLGAEPRDWHRYTGDVRLLAWTACHEPILELLRVVFASELIPESLQPDPSPQSGDVHAGFSICAASGARVVDGLAIFNRRHVPSTSMSSRYRAPSCAGSNVGQSCAWTIELCERRRASQYRWERWQPSPTSTARTSPSSASRLAQPQ
jgi:hypothetical protein